MHKTDVMKTNTLLLTPTEDLNVINMKKNPEMNIDKYELRIDGLVENLFALIYSDFFLLSYPAKKC